jgi:RNA polymerase sigma-70 factor (ECF subfamily)
LTDAVRDVSELRTFVSEHADQIFAKARILCYGSTDAASEVVQELYPRLLAILERSPSGLKNPWAAVHRVAANLAIDCYRRESRARRYHSLPDNDELVDTRCSGVEIKPDVAAINEAISGLPPRLQLAVQGVFLHGRTGKEVAATMAVSEARFTELKQEALRRLRVLLGGAKATT